MFRDLLAVPKGGRWRRQRGAEFAVSNPIELLGTCTSDTTYIRIEFTRRYDEDTYVWNDRILFQRIDSH